MMVLVDAGLGVGDLIETGQFEPEGVAALALVHVVPEGQDHLQELRQGPTPHHLLGCQIQSCNDGQVQTHTEKPPFKEIQKK